MIVKFPPPFIHLSVDEQWFDEVHQTQILCALVKKGYAVLSAHDAQQWWVTEQKEVQAIRNAWLPTWDDLPPDGYLKDGGRYRYRRHSCFVVDWAAGGLHGEESCKAQPQIQSVPQRPHWQPLAYNALHGGMQRHFSAMSSKITESAVWQQMLIVMSNLFWQAKPHVQKWCIEAHQFRIDTTDGIGRPTPEGAHRDGVDFVVVILCHRENVKGGETRVFDANSPNGQRFTMVEPWTTLLLDDETVIHESTPIQPLDGQGTNAWRDTLVLTFKADTFQGD